MGSCCSVEEEEYIDRRRQSAFIVARGHHLPGPFYGEFKCPLCGRFWRSLRSWRNEFQACKNCGEPVLPTNQREIRSTDRARNQEEVGRHCQELCQRCQNLGRYCGR